MGFGPNKISARALRAGGAMALLCANVDKHTIQLLGRWKSDKVLRYIHLQAYPQMSTFARLMITHGRFTNQYPDTHIDAYRISSCAITPNFSLCAITYDT